MPSIPQLRAVLAVSAVRRLVAFACGALAAVAAFAAFPAEVRAQGPGIFPPPPAPAGNPITPAKALLGKALFWDEQLSSSRSVACGTCHRFAGGGADPRAVASRHPGPDGLFATADDIGGSPGVVQHDASGRPVHAQHFGIREQVTTRRAPSVINSAWQAELFWDGRASGVFADPISGATLLPAGAALETQAISPPLSPVEMAHAGRSWAAIAAELAPMRPLALADQVPPALAAFVAGQTYDALFTQTFGPGGVTPARIAMAIATYERTLVSDQSPFDLYLAGQGTLSQQEGRGLQVFQALCASCHLDLSATVLTYGPVLHDFRNVGVRPVTDDLGRSAVTGAPRDQGRFKVPGLRNVALRAPYFHNGGKQALGDVVAMYANGGDFRQNIDPAIGNIVGALSPSDQLAVLAFLRALNDPRVANETTPFDRPRLWSEGPRVPDVFGIGTPGLGGFRPRSIALWPPFAGNAAFTLGLDEAAPGAPFFLGFDTVATPAPTVVLGLNVHLGLSPAFSLVGMAAPTLGSGAGGGYGSLTFPIPPGLQGLQVFGQWLLVDPAGPNGLTTSDAFGLLLF